jgi:hypothetical protein
MDGRVHLIFQNFILRDQKDLYWIFFIANHDKIFNGLNFIGVLVISILSDSRLQIQLQLHRKLNWSQSKASHTQTEQEHLHINIQGVIPRKQIVWNQNWNRKRNWNWKCSCHPFFCIDSWIETPSTILLTLTK